MLYDTYRWALSAFSFASILLLTSCGGSSGRSVTPTDTLSVSPQPASIPANSTVTFTAASNVDASHVNWGIVSDEPTVGNPNGTVNVGSPRDSYGAITFTYTAPPSPPVYENIPYGPPGSVTLRVLAGLAPMVQFTFVITAPSITTGFFSGPRTVALGQTINISAYAVGSTNNAIAMQVNGVTGGSLSTGTITVQTGALYGNYQYNAPTAMPMTGSTVTITVISQADPTKSSSIPITLTTT